MGKAGSSFIKNLITVNIIGYKYTCKILTKAKNVLILMLFALFIFVGI